MQRINRVVLMLSGGAMLSGITSGAVSLGWDAWSAMRLRASSLQSLGTPEFAPSFGSPPGIGLAVGRPSSTESMQDPRVNSPTIEVPPDAQAPRFSFVPLDGSIAGRTLYPVALNNRGEVLGGIVTRDTSRRFEQTRLEAVLYRDGVVIPIKPPPGFRYSWPMALNNRGQAVCIAYGLINIRPAGNASSGAPAGQASAVGSLSSPSRNVDSNTNGATTVSADLGGTHQNHVTLWENGVSRDLHIAEQLAQRGVGGNVLESLYRTRIGINDRTQITLQLESLYWWGDGKLHLAGGRMPPNAPLLPLNNQSVLVRPSVRAIVTSYNRMVTPSLEWYDVGSPRETALAAGEVWDMNNRSEVLCSNFYGGAVPLRHYWVADKKGSRRIVASVPYFGPSFLNDGGQVVGLASRAVPGRPRGRQYVPATPPRGPFWVGANRLYDLNDLIPAGSGWTILRVCDFNDRGEILVLAYDTDQRVHPLLLRPLPMKTPTAVPVAAMKQAARR